MEAALREATRLLVVTLRQVATPLPVEAAEVSLRDGVLSMRMLKQVDLPVDPLVDLPVATLCTRQVVVAVLRAEARGTLGRFGVC